MTRKAAAPGAIAHRRAPSHCSRRHILHLLVAAAVLMGSHAVASQVVLRTLAASSSANLLRNGTFAQTNISGFANWTAAPNGCRVAVGEGRTNSVALACSAPDTAGWRGAGQTLTLNRSQAVPVRIRGWSRAENLTGSADADYSIYVDIIYADGTPLWGQTGDFSCGTHDWELREFTILPQKPIKTLSFYCLLRGNHVGNVWFDDVAVEELQTSGSALLFQGTPMELVAVTNAPPLPSTLLATSDGLRLGLAQYQAVSLRVDGRELAGNVPSGFLVRDIATNSDVYLCASNGCPELGLDLRATVTERSNHIVIEGRLSDTTGRDRAVMLLFALPIEAAGWQWHDDLRQARTIEGNGEYDQVGTVRCGTTGGLSLYPVAALTQEPAGLALAMDMGRPSVYRLVYHAGTRQLFVACDFGLVPETARAPGAADFRFVLFRFDAKWGFRSAWAKLQEIFPDYFTVRSRSQGIWMPFTDIGTVQGWEDFGFRYQEGAPNIAFDDKHGMLSFRYTEPMTWWMPMAANISRTIANALAIRDAYAQGPEGVHQQMATISKTAAMEDATGQPSLLFRDTPWANGAVWSLNPNPLLPATPNAATVYWNDSIKARLYSNSPPTGLDGEYLDSLEGYVTAEVNLNRDHFRWTSVPLTFTSDTRQPALFKGLAVYEFTHWISEDVHRLGRLVFANGVPYRFGFLCPWLDVLGTETDWLPGGTYQPSSHSQMSYWRTLSGAKPYLMLMNTDFEAFAPYVERYFQRCLFYGFYPSMFSHNASENPYWQNPAWYNRDRLLFRKYLPVIREVAEAGWQPVPGANCDNSAIWVERFGANSTSSQNHLPLNSPMAHYYSLSNDSAQSQTGLLTEDTATGGGTNFIATDMLSGTILPHVGAGWKVTLAPQAVTAIRVEPGPRFRSAQLLPSGQVRLTIASPLGLPQVLEAAYDLEAWQPRVTNSPAQTPYVIDVPQSPTTGAEFYRLRY